MGEPAKSLGERLHDACATSADTLTWKDLDVGGRDYYERAAVAFTASLSDADPILREEVERLRLEVTRLREELDCAWELWQIFARRNFL